MICWYRHIPVNYPTVPLVFPARWGWPDPGLSLNLTPSCTGLHLFPPTHNLVKDAIGPGLYVYTELKVQFTVNSCQYIYVCVKLFYVQVGRMYMFLLCLNK